MISKHISEKEAVKSITALRLGIDNLPVAMDAVLLLAWLYWESVKNKIVSFI